MNADGIINANKDFLSDNLYIYTSNNYITYQDTSGYFIDILKTSRNFLKSAAKTLSNLIGKKANMPASSGMLNSALAGTSLNNATKNIVTNKIKNSSEMKKEVNKCVSKNKNKNYFVCEEPVNGSTGFVSDKDLHGAVGKANYIIQGVKNDSANTIDLNITVYDRYDFTEWRWSFNWLDWANNFGLSYQSMGLLTPYNWDISYTISIPTE